MHYQNCTVSGKAYLESNHVLFRGPVRLKILTKDLETVTAEAGMLILAFPGGPASFELGAAAAKWAHKILHPPTRATKLGITPGLQVRLVGQFEPTFADDLRAVDVIAGKGKGDLTFFAAEDRPSLERIPELAATLKPAGALWVVFPKGVATIREIEVICACRSAGLKDTKVASFSATHTALRFVIPIASR